MKYRTFSIIAGCSAFVLCALAAARGQQPKQTVPAANAQNTASTQASDGEKLFRTHCGRCHNSPESISPREARAVVRHMRVRAMLTTEDEKLILKFLAP